MKKLLLGLFSLLFLSSSLFGQNIQLDAKYEREFNGLFPIYAKKNIPAEHQDIVSFRFNQLRQPTSELKAILVQYAPAGFEFIGMGRPGFTNIEVSVYGKHVDTDYISNNNSQRSSDTYQLIKGPPFNDKQLVRFYCTMLVEMSERSMQLTFSNTNFKNVKIYLTDIKGFSIRTEYGFDWESGDRFEDFIWISDKL